MGVVYLKSIMVASKKIELAERLRGYLDDYTNVLLVTVNNVGSKQFAQIRFALRGKAHIFKGKNTMIKFVIKDYIAKTGKNELQALLDLVGDNMAFAFCIDPVDEVRKIILSNVVPAPAKPGAIAPLSYTIPRGPTTLEPGMTSFFQALGIATTIVKGKIEISNAVQVITEGQKVGASEATLLHKMNILPFTYGFVATDVYENGTVYPSAVLDTTDEMLTGRLQEAIQKVAALGLATGIPNTASVPHTLVNAFKRCAA